MRPLFAILLLVTVPLTGFGWEEKGHRIINTLTIDAVLSKLPPFTEADRGDLIYNGNEPDYWREEAGTPMNIAQSPDHFFDSERWGSVSTIEPDRYKFMAKLAERKIELDRVGYLPYAIVENYGRLVNAFRSWRNAKNAVNRKAARDNAVHYAGLMGH